MKIKRKLSFFLAIIMVLITFSTFTVSAAKSGDKLGNVLYSDITAYINGNAIPTSVIQGKTLVVVEDLANYGFTVNWNGNERTLKVEYNPNKAIKPLSVEKNTRPSGTYKCDYFYTDIKTYLSGKLVESFAIQGVTLIDFELLESYGKLIWNGQTRELKLQLSGSSNSSDLLDTSKYVFALTDDEIKQAIKEGEKGFKNYINNIEPKYIVKPNKATIMSKYNIIKIFTPYFYIAASAALASEKYNIYSFSEAKKHYNSQEQPEVISISIILYELNYKSTSNYVIGVFQDDKKIDASIKGLTGYPDDSDYYPYDPAYKRFGNISIFQSDIDINKPITVKIKFASEETVYEIYLKNYK